MWTAARIKCRRASFLRIIPRGAQTERLYAKANDQRDITIYQINNVRIGGDTHEGRKYGVQIEKRTRNYGDSSGSISEERLKRGDSL
jgi:hypothetical protein